MFEAALFVGGAFGVRHAFEADHLAAVATLIEEEEKPVSTGAAWGIGHSIPILALGTIFLVLDIQLPSVVATGFEVLVAPLLVLLGIRAIIGRRAVGTALLRHVHTDDDEISRGKHLHLPVAGRQIGIAHSHADEESFAVGIVHGLAGSGGVVVALVAASQTISGGAGFLAGFSVATVVSMALAAWTWGRVVGWTSTLRVVSGIASVAVGILLLAEISGITVPL